MKVKRIVTNVAARNVEAARAFYEDVLGLDVRMDMGWIVTFGSDARMTVQLSVMSEGGSGTPVPDMWITFISDPDGIPYEFVQRPRHIFR